MSEQAIRTRIGLFVVFALLLLGALIVMFSGLPALFTKSNRYTLVLDNAAGVGVGTPVRRSGVKIGEVRNVELDDETGKVRAEIDIPSKYTIRKNEVPLLSRTGGLLGDLAIDFVPKIPDGKEPDRTPVEPGSELQAVPQIDISASLTQLNRAADNFNKLSQPLEEAVRELGALAKISKTAVPEIEIAARNWASVGERTNILLRTNEEKLVKTLDNINETFARASQVLNEENQRNLSATLKNVRGASENLNDLTKSTDEVLKEGRQTLKQVNGSLVKVDQVMTNLERVTKPLADRSESMSRNLDESSDRLNKILMDVQELLKTFGQNDGTLQRLMRDPSLYQNVDAFACGLTKLLPRLERIMKDIEIFADKIARHPEALGVGGAVRPGSGLK